MILKEIEINNYRGLDNVIISNKEPIKFLFGDNGVGKSSVLELLNTIFNKNSFIESDFRDKEKCLEVKITIYLSNLELGYFDELFESDNENEIKIKVIQEKINGRIEFIHESTETIIPYSKIKNIPFVYYNSVKAPEELNFSKTKTAGKFLNNIIEKYIITNSISSKDIISEEKIESIASNINELICKVKLIKNSGITAKLENDATKMIPNLIGLSNEEQISINNMGSGIRYMSYIFFEILNTIMNSIDLNQDIKFKNEEGKVYMPVIIVLDEPEIHLHPYMQRNLINDINKILKNQDESFLNLLKECFGIDYLIGQIIISTHSPNILSNNYKEYIRMYKKNNVTCAKSGDEFVLDLDDERHLFLNIQDIKETFFSKTSLLYEGISEIGTIPYFAEKLGIDLDYLKISVISANGKKNIKPLKKLLELFDINSVAVLDRDDDNIENGYMYTSDRDLECDIVNKIIENDSVDELINVINMYEKDQLTKFIQKDKLDKNSKKLGIQINIVGDSTIIQAIESKDTNFIKLVLITWLWNVKDMVRGRLLGKNISIKNIPQVYVDSIKKAKEISENV